MNAPIIHPRRPFKRFIVPPCLVVRLHPKRCGRSSVPGGTSLLFHELRGGGVWGGFAAPRSLFSAGCRGFAATTSEKYRILERHPKDPRPSKPPAEKATV